MKVMKEIVILRRPSYPPPWTTSIIINGVPHSENVLPIPKCETCLEGDGFWPFDSARKLPPRLLEELRRVQQGDKGGLVTIGECENLRELWRTECAAEFGFRELPYGARFAPWTWRFPSVPKALGVYWDFAVMCIGSGVRRCFDEFGLDSVAYSVAELTAVGTLDPLRPQELPQTEDLDEVMSASECLEEPSCVGEFFACEPLCDTWNMHREEMSRGVCSNCGRAVLVGERYEALSIQSERWKRRRVIPMQHVPVADLFKSDVYKSIGVSVGLYEAIRDHRLENFEAEVVRVIR